MRRKKVLILGGGLSGLAAGELLSKDFNVNVFETNPFLGGLAATFEHGGKRIPLFYHHIIKSNNYTKNYLKKFGHINLKNLKWKKIKVAVGINKKLFIINSIFGLIKFKYLNFYEKIRFGLFGLYSLFLMDPKKIPEGLDAETWLNKYVGKAVSKKIFFHLYSKNKFNVPLNKISAKQFSNRLYEKEIQDFFSFPKQGYQGMINGLKTEIEKNKGKVKTKSKVQKIDLKNKYIIESGKKINYDMLINTIPSEIFIKLAKNIPKKFKDQISKIKYCPGVGLCFGTQGFLDKKHRNIYWINLFNENIHIIMQHSVICDVYGDKINWCLRYGGSEEDLNLNDKEIKKKYLNVIKKYFPKANIKWVRVAKTKYAEPIYDINYHKYMPSYKTPIKDLYFSGIQLTYPKIRNMNAALESGIKVANIILDNFKLSQKH